jgi:trimethylamine-N-oxide reductase (cytochrome c) cytochrome c-type subunit TorY
MATENSAKSEKSTQKKAKGRKGKGKLIIPVLLVGVVLFFVVHEATVMYFADKVCIVCHEMKEPVRKWEEAGVDKNHRDCGGCHFDAGLARHWQMNVSAARFLVVHFQRDPEEPLKPAPEPLFVDPHKEPAYYSLVPNRRCFQCKDAKNHKPIEQTAIHAKLMRFSNAQPCKDCHNHEMRNGQKFYERVLPEKEKQEAEPEKHARR